MSCMLNVYIQFHEMIESTIFENIIYCAMHTPGERYYTCVNSNSNMCEV